MLDIKFLKNPRKSAETAIILGFEDKPVDISALGFDQTSADFIKKALKSSKSYGGKLGQVFSSPLPGKDQLSSIVIVGLGKSKDLQTLSCENAGGHAYGAIEKLQTAHGAIFLDHPKSCDVKHSEILSHFTTGLLLKSYKFEKYKSKHADNSEDGADKKSSLNKLDIIHDDHKAIENHFKVQKNIIDGVFLARDFVNEPPNAIQPENYAKQIKDALKPLGISVEILDEKKLQKYKMGGILAVGQGSEIPPCIVIMEWDGTKKKGTKPTALVGKGVTFDTGGISIKPSNGMEDMKMDMAGSAAVVGTMKALALNKTKAHVIGAVGLAENMPSHNAYRPGDIITSYSGRTIEILNTDAEGRLVLGDVLTYVQKTYKPKQIIDLATLTGAMMVALAHEYCGTFSNDDELWQDLAVASANTGEKLWRMPLDAEWKKQMKSEVADIKNLASASRYGGACTAAGFLEYFIEKDMKWAHMDIAGTAWIKSPKPTTPKFGTGFGVRVLYDFIANQS